MSKFYDAISDEHAEFIAAQKIMFVATAPLSTEGHINLSPKGMDCFRILSPHRVAYLDLTGSGNETSAHIAENGRITFMFCAFDHPPLIMRLYGIGRTALPGDDEWDDLVPRFPALAGTRQIIVADIYQMQTSCGFAVPLMDFVSERDTLVRWAENKGTDAVKAYQQEKNIRSLDGLPTPLQKVRA